MGRLSRLLAPKFWHFWRNYFVKFRWRRILLFSLSTSTKMIFFSNNCFSFCFWRQKSSRSCLIMLGPVQQNWRIRKCGQFFVVNFYIDFVYRQTSIVKTELTNSFCITPQHTTHTTHHNIAHLTPQDIKSQVFLKMGHSRTLFLYFRLQYKFCKWLNSNLRPLVS